MNLHIVSMLILANGFNLHSDIIPVIHVIDHTVFGDKV